MSKKTEINPFGKITDYLSLSLSCDDNSSDNPYQLTDGTVTINFRSIKLENSNNTDKPFMFIHDSGYLLLTFKQVTILFEEFLRYNNPSK